MTTHLTPVLTSTQISESVRTFSVEASHNQDLTRSHVSQTTYWVYDKETDSFGPSKFVAFVGMDFDKYRAANEGDRTGAPFDGGFTHSRIERVLESTYEENEGLKSKLFKWATENNYADIDNHQITDKWKFLVVQDDGLDNERPVNPLKLYSTYSRCEVRDIFAPGAPCQPQRGAWGLHGIISIPGRPGDYVFFVTFGQSQAGHEFDESITEEGVLSWQSQPSQDLLNKRIRHFINHDELRNSIYLFLRPNRDLPYTYLGRLKYLDHDTSRERPVYFRWQILDWDRSNVDVDAIGLNLTKSGISEPLPGLSKPYGLSLTEPPKPRKRGSKKRTFTTTKGINYSGNDAKNKQVGISGEKLVVQYEKEMLLDAGRTDLLADVKHVSVEEGDGAGYDILSFTDQGDRKYIEVKTTTTGPNTQFFISPNELEFSAQHPDEFYLYRVYLYDSTTNSGKVYVLQGDVSEQLTLSPTEFRAGLRGDQESEPVDFASNGGS